MILKRSSSFAAASLFVLACSACAQTAMVKNSDGNLVDPGGKTLYTFDKDTRDSGKSACNGPCATLWPPVTATSAAPPYTLITRDDGTKQLAYKGMPLYLYSKDKAPGERSGDNFRDIWHVVKE